MFNVVKFCSKKTINPIKKFQSLKNKPKYNNKIWLKIQREREIKRSQWLITARYCPNFQRSSTIRTNTKTISYSFLTALVSVNLKLHNKNISMEITSEESTQLKKGPWTPEEDRKLIDCIHKHGHGNWKELPKLAGLNRCGKSCRLRWTNYLRPDIKRGAFSDEEEALIIELHSKLGNKWSTIASYLPGRTDNEIKNFWNTQLKKKLIQNGIDPVSHLPRMQISSFLPQFLGCGSSKNPTWENVVRYQTDAAHLTKILLIGNILQLLNNGQSPRLPMEAFTRSLECSPMGLQLEGFDPKPEYNTLTCYETGPNSIPHQPGFQNEMETDSLMEVNRNEFGELSTIYTDYTVPDLVSASPERLSTDQTKNNVMSTTDFPQHSSTSMTFNDLGDLMDDEASNYYWKQIIDQAILSP
ncbi:hypothetical protein ACS0TY_000400 [Phlomoides rotata]